MSYETPCADRFLGGLSKKARASQRRSTWLTEVLLSGVDLLLSIPVKYVGIHPDLHLLTP